MGQKKEAPVLRGLLTKQIARNMTMMLMLNVAVLISKKVFLDNARIQRYETWYKENDPDQLYEKMVAAGVIWSGEGGDTSGTGKGVDDKITAVTGDGKGCNCK